MWFIDFDSPCGLNDPSYLLYCLDLASITVTSHSVKFTVSQTATSSERRILSHVRGGAPNPSGYSLPLIGSASFLVLTLVHALSVALLGPFSSLLLSFAGDISPSVGLPYLTLPFSLKFFRRPEHPAAQARGNSERD